MAEKYGWTVDPVDLLTGSFKWEYQDLALYGKDDLPFIRYYNSSDFEDDHGLGLGWSSNYTAFLDIENLFVGPSCQTAGSSISTSTSTIPSGRWETARWSGLAGSSC